VLVDSVPGEGLDQVSERRSLDDEHTPGVFMVKISFERKYANYIMGWQVVDGI
jgi:hypothetical protein